MNQNIDNINRNKPDINKNNIVSMLETPYIKVFDYQYAEGRHYYNATRRSFEDLMVLKSDEDFKAATPDAVTIMVVLCVEGDEPRLLLAREYRYPAGQFLLSPPAGVLDPEDKKAKEPVLSAAKRELKEETGIVLNDNDKIFVINPLLFSTPGMTDESNAIACAVVHLKDLSILTQNGAEASELFDGFRLLTKSDAKNMIKNGRDEDGLYYSVFTQIVLNYFVQDRWMEE